MFTSRRSYGTTVGPSPASSLEPLVHCGNVASFKMLVLTFSSKLDWGSYIISITISTYKKIEALIRSMKFLSTEVALYLYKSTICPCMEYCCHV